MSSKNQTVYKINLIKTSIVLYFMLQVREYYYFSSVNNLNYVTWSLINQHTHGKIERKEKWKHFYASNSIPI